ncbi:MAG: hypothetical protein K2X02_03295 [Alphaproteobacteria bacterium]|nr:hypothetical protein [Alphaproteobacteria bacterium]
MKRYLALLTLSFLSTSTFVKAGQFDISNLSADLDEKVSSLTVKAVKLQRNIENTENTELRDAFSIQLGVINDHIEDLVRGRFNPPNFEAYSKAQEQKSNIKTNFAKEVMNGTHIQQLIKLLRVLEWQIYPNESQESQDIFRAFQILCRSEHFSSKDAGHYLKKEKLITQHLEKADKMIEEYRNDLKKINASNVLSDLEIIKDGLDHESIEYRTVKDALTYLVGINKLKIMHNHEYGRRYDTDVKFNERTFSNLITAVKYYKELEKKLEPLLISYRQSKQDAPASIASVLSDASDYKKLEEGIDNGPSSSSSSSSSGSSMPSLAPADEPALQASTPIFHMGKRDDYHQTKGFSAYEGTHRWTEGMEASITLPFEKMRHRPSRISFFDTRGLITDRHPQQNLTVKVNGEEVGRYVYTFTNNNQTIDIPLPKTGPATIEFEILKAISPLELEINSDPRKLGISFREFKFYN